MTQNRSKTYFYIRSLVEGALFVAIAYALGMVKFFHMPQGGSVSLLMLPILLYAIRFGVGPGMVAGLALGIIDFMIGGGIAIGWQSILGDYVIACTLMGLAGLLRGKGGKGVFIGAAVGTLGRYLSIWVTGATLWGEYMPESFWNLPMTNEWIYSALYNANVLVSGVLAIVILGIFYASPALRRYLLGQDLGLNQN